MTDILLYLRSLGGPEMQHIAVVRGSMVLAEYFQAKTRAACGMEFGRSAQYSRRRFRAAVLCPACRSHSSLFLEGDGKKQGVSDPGGDIGGQSGVPLMGGGIT